jgi:hypothetical protein
MRRSFPSAAFYFLLFIFLAGYLAVSVSVDLLHNHEPSFEFHDNCPACQWNALHQDDFSQAGSLLNLLNDPLCCVGQEYYILSLIIPSECQDFSCSSRAPPQPV